MSIVRNEKSAAQQPLKHKTEAPQAVKPHRAAPLPPQTAAPLPPQTLKQQTESIIAALETTELEPTDPRTTYAANALHFLRSAVPHLDQYCG